MTTTAERYSSIPVQALELHLNSRFYHRFGKRMMDITVTAPSLLVALPIITGAALTNKLLQPNEHAFYVTKRLGKDGREIPIIKIRSLKSDAGGEKPIDQVDRSRFYNH